MHASNVNQESAEIKVEEQTLIKALLIIGDTYTSRREIKALGGKWNPDEGGWLAPVSDAMRELAKSRGWTVKETEVDQILLEHPTGERLRAIRQAKIDRKCERKLAQAERLEKLSDKEAAKLKPYDDYAFWTQPILVGHHSEKSHRKLRDRLDNAMSKSAKYYTEAQELRSEATPHKARIAGDAARRDEKIRDALDKVVTVGSRINDFVFGEGTVVKVFKKSYRIKWDRSGNTWAREKHFVRPLGEKDE